MTKKKPTFWGQLLDSLAPPENRLVAAVAFVRTFEQGLTGSSFTAAGGGITLTAVGLTQINWQTVGLAAAAVLLAALIGAIRAWRDVLTNGLNRKYAEAVATTLERVESGSPARGE